MELAGSRDQRPVRAGGTHRRQPRPALASDAAVRAPSRLGRHRPVTATCNGSRGAKVDLSAAEDAARRAGTGTKAPGGLSVTATAGSSPTDACGSPVGSEPRTGRRCSVTIPGAYEPVVHGAGARPPRPHPHLSRAAAPHLRPARGRHRCRHRRRRQPRHRLTSSGSPPSDATTVSSPASSTTASSSPATPTSTLILPTTSSRSAATTGSTTASSTSCRRRTRCWRSSGQRSSTRTARQLAETRLGYLGGVGIRVYPRALLEPTGYRPADEDRTRNCDFSHPPQHPPANQPQPGPGRLRRPPRPPDRRLENHPASS